MEKNTFGAKISCSVERGVIVSPQSAIIKSIWDVEHWRGNNLLSVTRDFNKVTNEGLDALLDIMFHASTQITTWYVLLFNTNTTILATHTYAVPGFTESTDYDESVRQEYEEAAASSQSMTNSSNKAVFTMSGTTTIYGAALVGGGSAASTKDDQAGGGTLYCASLFTASKTVEDDDVLNITITLSAADS